MSRFKIEVRLGKIKGKKITKMHNTLKLLQPKMDLTWWTNRSM